MTFRRALCLFVSALISVSVPLSGSVAAETPKVEILGGDVGEVTISADGEVRHNAADFGFPRQIGDMPLRKVQVYGPADVGVEYTLLGGGNGDAWITLFVFPALHPFSDELADVDSSLVKQWSATRIPARADPPLGARDGGSAWFEGTFNGVHATTGYVLVQRRDWLLEARYTIPDAAGAPGIDRTIRALNSAPWDWTPTKPSPVSGPVPIPTTTAWGTMPASTADNP